MGDAEPAVGGGHFIARAHEMLSGLDLELRRPAGIRPQLGDVQRIGGETRNRPVEPGDLRLSHQVEADALGRDGTGMAVLHPQHDLFAVTRSRQAGIEIRRPGIGVMGAGQHRWRVAIGVQRVFHDVVAGAVDHMHEKLAGEVVQPMLRAHFGAVDHHGGVGAAQRLFPGHETVAVSIEQRGPDAGVLGAVSAPIIRRDQPRMVAIALTEEGEVGGEVDRRQILPLVGQQRVGHAHLVQGDHIGAVRHEMADLVDQPAGVEGRDQHDGGAASGQLADRPRRLSRQRLADAGDVLHEGAGDGHRSQIVQGGEGLELRQRVIDRNRAGGGQPCDQRLALGRCLGMAERLEQRHAAAGIREGLDVQGHDRPAVEERRDGRSAEL